MAFPACEQAPESYKDVTQVVNTCKHLAAHQRVVSFALAHSSSGDCRKTLQVMRQGYPRRWSSFDPLLLSKDEEWRHPPR